MRLVEDMTEMTLGKLREFVVAAEASGTPLDSRVQMTNKRTGEVTTITLEYGHAVAEGFVAAAAADASGTTPPRIQTTDEDTTEGRA